MTLFTSDLHFGHKNINTLCNRPFSDVSKMDRTLIEKWNKKVKKNDTVYIIGDLVWDKRSVGLYMEQLSGRKILISGNHDSSWVKRDDVRGYFEYIEQYLEIHLNSHPITMCHYPMLEWKSSRKEGNNKLGFLIHGHIHNRVSEEYRELFLKFNALNAGVDINGYEPVSFEELVENNMKFKLSALKEEEDKVQLLRGYNLHFGG